MTYRPKGKYVAINENSPAALGVCDYSGFTFKREDLEKQMEWRGNALVWTGYMVGRPFLDEPNEQLRPPILPPDPIPVQNPRTLQQQVITWNQGLGLPWNQINMYTWDTWGGFFDGVQQLSNAEKLQELQNYNWGSA